MQRKGYFIAFEGIDGSGKSTVAELIAGRLRREGYDVLVTHEPTREKFGRHIYEILSGKDSTVTPFELQRLYVLDRKEHVETVIRPALLRGRIVIGDRYWLSTLAYGMLSGPAENLIQLHEEIFQGDFLKPDMTFIFDLPADTALERLKNISKGKDYFEQVDKLSSIRKNYLALCHTVNMDCVIVDAAVALDSIVATIFQQLSLRLPSRK